MTNQPHLFYCDNLYYISSKHPAPGGEFLTAINVDSGQEAYDRYSQECVELFTSFNSDFWILLANNEISFKSDIEVEFNAREYSMLELVVIAENLIKIKPYERRTEDRIFQCCSHSFLSRLNALGPMMCALECSKFVKKELNLLSEIK